VRRTEAQRRVAALLDDVVKRSGRFDPPPDLRIVRTGGAATHLRRDGRFRIEVPLRYARNRSDEALLATVAHELAHIEYGDPEPPQDVGRKMLLLAALVAAGAALGGLLIRAWAELPVRWGINSGGALGALVFIVVMLARRALRDHADGRSRPREELRADLRAVQLAGPDAVLEMLSLHAEPGWVDRLLHELSPTHPPGALRRAAVAAYDGITDPDTASRTHL
jgi:Zn-dependent protease with chaperone function